MAKRERVEYPKWFNMTSAPRKEARRCDMCKKSSKSVYPRLYGDRKHVPVQRCDECHDKMMEYWDHINSQY
jgi:hypothetical protein